ncbi:hypothetical protein [Sinorhizobium fredii]|uniref:hypothetical protein n=1 Tax=Rhizobium fredii TaxID=380 RepID=UPI00339931E6
MPDALIGQIIGNRTGLGETGETILLDGRGAFLTDSARTADNDILQAQMPQATMPSGDGIVSSGLDDFRGEAIRMAATGLNAFGTRWNVAAVMTSQEAFAAVTALRNWTLLAALAVLVAAIPGAIWFSHRLTRPIASLVADGVSPAATRRSTVPVKGEVMKSATWPAPSSCFATRLRIARVLKMRLQRRGP